MRLIFFYFFLFTLVNAISVPSSNVAKNFVCLGGHSSASDRFLLFCFFLFFLHSIFFFFFCVKKKTNKNGGVIGKRDEQGKAVFAGRHCGRSSLPPYRHSSPRAVADPRNKKKPTK